MQIESRLALLSEIKPYERNPRKISSEKFDELKKSIQEFPEMLVMRKVVVDETMTILGGTMRYEALLALGKTQVHIDIVRGLTEKQKKEFRIKDNINVGNWNWDILTEDYDLDMLTDWGLESVNYEKYELEDIDANDFDFGSDTGVTFSYEITFNNAKERDKFANWVMSLESKYKDLETISERILMYIDENE